jgi:hypothetical protein
MAGRAHGTEGVADLAHHHRVHRRHHGAGGAQGRLARLRRDHGVGVEVMEAPLRNLTQDGVDEIGRMDAGELVAAGPRRLSAVEIGEILALEGVQDGAQAIGRFGMAERRFVIETGRVTEQGSGHQAILA